MRNRCPSVNTYVVTKLALRCIDFGWPFISQTIQWWTSSWVTHVDIIHGDHMISAYPNGVEWRNVGDFPAIREEIIELYCSKDQERRLLLFLNRQVGKPYDVLGPILYPLGINHGRTWFCSALVAAALDRADILSFKHPCLTSPGDIYRAAKGTPCATETS